MNAYDFALEEELSNMTVGEFLRWNPHFTATQAAERISVAKATISRAHSDGLFREV